MEKYKKSYDSMIFNKSVSTLKTEEGVVELDLSNRSREFYSTTKQFYKKTTHLHDTISVAITKMLDSYRQAMIDTYAVVVLFAELHDAFGEINNKFPTLKVLFP